MNNIFTKNSVIYRPGYLSESEYEDDQQEMELPQDLKARGCQKGTKTKLRLVIF